MKNKQLEMPEFELLYDNQDDNNYENQVKLWRAVIEKALDDAVLPPSNKRYRTWRKNARAWFDLNNSDFIDVCELALVDKYKILQIYSQLC